MKPLFLIIILLTTAVSALAQGVARRVIFTVDYGTEIFSVNPVSGRYTKASLPYSATYINAHRGSGTLLINFGEANHSPELIKEVREYLHYDTITLPKTIYIDKKTTLEEIRKIWGADVVIAKTTAPAGVSKITNLRGDTLTLVNFGTNPGKFVGVIDTLGNIRLVDITDFYQDKNFTLYFESQYAKLRQFYTETLTTFSDTIDSRDHYFGASRYSELFHKFQIETTHADISFFAPQKSNDIIFGEISRANLYVKDSVLVVIELSGKEIVDIMQRIASGWFRRMNSAEDDMLNVHTYNDKIYPYYGCYSAYGINYTVNLTRKPGSMVVVDIDPQKRYTVACSDRFIKFIGRKDYKVIGKYDELLWQWLAKNDNNLVKTEKNWRILPLEWCETAKKREAIELF